MAFTRPELIFKALVALDEVIDRAKDGPVDRDQSLRFCLAFLYACAGRSDRDPFDGFWRECVEPHEYAHADWEKSYMRTTKIRTQWNRIVRALGIHHTPAFTSAIFDARRGKWPKAYLAEVHRQLASGGIRKGQP